jgi:nucleoside 2-deoxyribosyltransferase
MESDHSTLMPLAYLANGLGFSTITSPALAGLVQRLEKEGLTVFEPFAAGKDLGAEIARLQQSEKNIDALKAKLTPINAEIGKRNAAAIDKSVVIVAILDGGLDLDSGVAAEIGYAAGKGKAIVALRTDFRISGDNYGSALNLQVEYFIVKSGGAIVTDVEALVRVLKRFHPSK